MTGRRGVQVIWLVLFLSSTLVGNVDAQEASGDAAEAKDENLIERFLEREEAKDSRAKDPRVPEYTPGVEGDETTRATYLEALRAHYRYRTEGFEHRMRVFRWQLLSERLIFCVVILLVLVGVVFSGIQFRIGLRGLEAGREGPSTQLKLSGKGVEVSSSILGVILLVISLAFFYLYLVYVYPIEEIF